MHIMSSNRSPTASDARLNPLATRDRALDDLITAMPTPVVADLFKYSCQVTTNHAAEAGDTFAHYAGIVSGQDAVREQTRRWQATTRAEPSGRSTAKEIADLEC